VYQQPTMMNSHRRTVGIREEAKTDQGVFVAGFQKLHKCFTSLALFDDDDISTKQASHRITATMSEAQAATNAETATAFFHVGLGQLVNVAPRS
jgi:hypothetical protein